MKINATADEVNSLARDLNENPFDWRIVTQDDEVHALWQAQASLVLDFWDDLVHRPGVFLANRKRGHCLVFEVDPRGYIGGKTLLHNVLFRMHKPTWELTPYRILWGPRQFTRRATLIKAVNAVLSEYVRPVPEPVLEGNTELGDSSEFRALPECNLHFDLE